MTDAVFRRLSIVLFCFLFAGSFIIYGPSVVRAQTFDNSVESRDIKMELDPPTPGSNQEVTVSVDSLIVNVNRMRITWFVDGEVVLSGIGETEISITTKGQGELTRVEAYIQVDNETNLRKWIQIAPADLDILWQADTYTPPFYRGKALPTPESFITVVGIPNLRNAGAQSQQRSVVFTWNHNGENLSEESGYGANPLVLRNDFLKLEERVNLNVVHSDGISRAEKSVVIDIVDPVINIYSEDAYMRNANQTDRLSSGQRRTFIAEPFFFSVTRDILKLLQYRWIVNERTTSPNSADYPFLIDVAGTGEGPAEIGISIRHPLKPLQLAPTTKFTVVQ